MSRGFICHAALHSKVFFCQVDHHALIDHDIVNEHQKPEEGVYGHDRRASLPELRKGVLDTHNVVLLCISAGVLGGGRHLNLLIALSKRSPTLISRHVDHWATRQGEDVAILASVDLFYWIEYNRQKLIKYL